MIASRFPLLFSPISINHLMLKNRIVMPPMCTAFATLPGAVTDRMVGYYGARARGGVGLINVEFSYVHPTGKSFKHMLGIHDDRLILGLKELTDAVHRGGAKIFVQISHAGRRTHSDIIGSLPVAPSPIPRLGGEVPRELDNAEIEEILHAFVAAARRAKKSGFDGVMIHMAHGYLINQFLSPFSNKRTDCYGGDTKARARFALEILGGIRKEVGQDYPISCRISGDEYVKGGIDLAEAIRIAKLLEAHGSDAIEVSAGTHETPEVMNAPSYFPMGFLAHLSAGIKKEVKIPVGVVGRIHDPHLAETLLKEGKADLIAVGRGLIADPEWPNKVYGGKLDDICPCLSCNQGCTDRMYYQHDISCTVNPSVGREISFPITPAKKKKKVFVLGGGPAGMEAARIAAMRGHAVTLYEKGSELGGQLKIASVPPSKESFEKLRKYLTREMEKLGVHVEHGVIDQKGIQKLSPDVVVVATGGRPRALDLPGAETERVVSAWEVLSRAKKVGHRVVIIGAGQVGLETADLLLSEGKEIILIEMLKQVGSDMSPRARKMLLEKLARNWVEILTDSKVVSIEKDGVLFNRAGVFDRITGIDSIVVAVGTIPEKPDLRPLGKMKCPVWRIGDCSAPRKVFDAIQEGFWVGMEI
jgi:2,4-dienoyl-CoA reductase-like NADH-dependent reductase (Old Yellow Enzyme family)/thioredoxin reductase